ncbi:MAG: hypothetical protein ACXADU_18690 [Promethearchaeota archaeon]
MNKKIFRLFIIFFFVIAIIGTATAWPSHMLEWEKNDHGSCHFGSYTVGSGGLMATVTPSGTKAPGQQFTVVIDINGFTEAADEHVLVGVSARLADNNEFFLGIQEDQGAYYAEGIEVGLDSSGNANNTVSLVFFAPAAEGNYTLSVIAAEGGESFPTAHAFDYLELLIDVEVVTPTAGGGAIPGFDVFIIVSVGLLTSAPIVLIVLHKRRKQNRR